MPTDPRDWLALEAVVTAFAAVNGSGVYATTLTSKVDYGLFPADRPPRQSLPCVAVGYESVEMSDGPDLPGTRCRVVLTVQGWAQGTADTASARMEAAATLASDLRQALRAARAAGSSSALADVHDLSFAVATVDARQLGIALTCGYIEGRVTFEYPLSYGEQE